MALKAETINNADACVGTLFLDHSLNYGNEAIASKSSIMCLH